MNFDGKPDRKDMEYVAINPVIVESKGSINDREGCLSFPGLYQNVRRAKSVKVQAYNLEGKLFEMACSDLPARVWQHEIDHLHGVLFIDKMGPLGRLGSKKDLEKFIADFEQAKKKGELPPGLEPKF
jgi:peptide deformylase